MVIRGPLNPPWAYPPPPALFPTDYDGLAGDTPPFRDSTQRLPHFGGGMEPGPHTYADGVINMANVQGVEDLLKKVWLRLEFMQGDPPVSYQTEGTVDPALWPTISAPNSTATLTGASWVAQNPWVHLYLTWNIEPQPASEQIDISVISNQMSSGAGGSRLNRIEVLTGCIPEPATLGVFALGILVAAQGNLARRRCS